MITTASTLKVLVPCLALSWVLYLKACDNSMKQLQLLSSFHRWRNWLTPRAVELVLQLASGRAGIPTQAVWWQKQSISAVLDCLSIGSKGDKKSVSWEEPGTKERTAKCLPFFFFFASHLSKYVAKQIIISANRFSSFLWFQVVDFKMWFKIHSQND